MDRESKNAFRAGFEHQIRQNFYSRPEFPFLPSMGCYHVFFPVRNEEHDFGFLILEWECLSDKVWNWVGTWVDTEEELINYKYKREGIESIVDMPKLIRLFAEHMAQVQHDQMMREKEETDWRDFVDLHRLPIKPYLN